MPAIGKAAAKTKEKKKPCEEKEKDSNEELGRTSGELSTHLETPEKISPIKDEKKEKRKRKRQELVYGEGDRFTNEESSKKQKNQGEAANAESEGMKCDKAKRKSSKHQNDANEGNTEIVEVRGKEKKKPKKHRKCDDTSADIPDPTKDVTLTDKPRNALTYAHARVLSPASWKFNKAHQNWIVKHFFSLNTVPDAYVPIVIGYLAGCKGGVRQSLVDTCKRHLEGHGSEVSDARKVAVESKSTETDNRSQESQEKLRVRAGSLLNALETSCT